jgi:DNA-binding transcriptional LysR family regulator
MIRWKILVSLIHGWKDPVAVLELNDIGIVRRGSFWEAGRRLGMRPNTVSRRIDQLEQELGVRLMQRSTRRLSDTTAVLIAHGIDVAVRGGETRNPNYVVRGIHSHPIGLVASPGYLAERGTPAELQEPARHDCVTSSSPRNRANWRLRDPDGVEKEVVVSCRFTANTAQALHRATLNGLGIALLPVMVVVDVTPGRLVPVLPRYRRSDPGVIVVYPSRRHLPRRCLHSSARDFTSRVNVGMAGVNTFGGCKRSGFGDLNQHGPDSIRFYTKTKTVTSRWPSGVKTTSNSSFRRCARSL